MKDLTSVKNALSKVYMFNAEVETIQNASNLRMLIPYFNRLEAGSMAKFFNSWKVK